MDPRRLVRRRGVLRRVRVPHHVAAARRARARRADRLGAFWLRRARRLLPALGRDARRRRRRDAGDRLGRPARRAAPRPAVGDRLPRQLGPDRRRRPVLRRRPAAAAAPVEPGDRGAVLPRLAAGVRRPRPHPAAATGRSPACSAARGRGRWSGRSGCTPAGPGRSTCSAASTGSTSCTCRRSRGPAGCCSARRRRSCGGRGGSPIGGAGPRPGGVLDAAGGVAIGRSRLHRRGRRADRRLRLPVAAPARVGALARRRARRRPPGGRGGAPGARLGARSWRSACAATGCTCGTGRSSCSPGRPTAPVGRFAVALAVTVVVSELCYRFVETPVRARVRSGAGGAMPARTRGRPLLAAAGVVVVLAAGVRRRRPVRPGGRRRGGRRSTRRPTTVAVAAAGRRPARRRWRRPLPRRVAVVGDSQAHSLAVNLPDGIGRRSPSTDGSLDGCSVYDDGRVHSCPGGLRQLVRDVRGLAGGVGRRGASATPTSRSSCSARGTCSTSRPATAPADVRHAGVGRPRARQPAVGHRRDRRRRARRWRCSRCRACARSVRRGRRRPAAARARRRRPRRPRQRAVPGRRRRQPRR